MSSSWIAEIRAVAQKEWRSERRAQHGLWTAGLFSVTAVTGMAFASFGQRPPPTLAAGMLAVTLLFTAVTAVPRTFLAEEEQGTMDLLRLLGRPETIYLGKMLYVLVQLLAQTVILSTLFVGLTSTPVVEPTVLVAGLAGYAFALATIVSFAGALAAGATNRWLLAGAVGMPLLLPAVAMAVGVLRVGFGAGFVSGAIQSGLSLLGFGVLAFASAPWMMRGLWGRDQ